MADGTTKDEDASWPALPTETEIYILPNGEIVVADLPEELAMCLTHLSPRASTPSAEESQQLYVTQ